MWQEIAVYLAMKAAESGAERLGQRIADALADKLFGPGDPYTTLNRESLEAIGSLINQRLAEQDLKECDQMIRALSIQFSEYRNNPALRERLTNAIITSTLLVEKLKDHGTPAIAAFSIAATLRIGLLLELAAQPDMSGEYRNVQARIADYSPHINRTATALRGSLIPLNRISECSCEQIIPQFTKQGDTIITREGLKGSVDKELLPIAENLQAIPRPYWSCTFFNGSRDVSSSGSAESGAHSSCKHKRDEAIRTLQEEHRRMDLNTSPLTTTVDLWSQLSISLN